MAETPEEKAAREADEAKAAKEAAEAKEAADAAAAEDAHDPDRAKATILRQREAEKKLKAELREARQAEGELAALKKAQDDADKTAAEKLAEAEEVIADLKQKISDTAVKADFDKQAAAERGIQDLELAYLAAKEQGLLGAEDPKTGEVGKHDFDKLEALYPSLAGEGTGKQSSGDAGVRSKGKVGTVNTQFNESVRSNLRR